MIPKILHYCWFGNAEMPNEHKNFIDGWKKMFPDYQIKRWSEKNFDVNSVSLIQEAIAKRKWAYVVDYVRHYALYNEGGIYMDTDVEVVKDFSPLLCHRFVSAVEFHPGYKDFKLIAERVENGKRISQKIKIPGTGIMSAFLASEPGHPLTLDCMRFYESENIDHIFEEHLTAPTVIAYCAEKYGFRYVDKQQLLCNDIMLYTSEVFSHDELATNDSYTIHHCEGSWVGNPFKHKFGKFIKNNRLTKGLFKKYLQYLADKYQVK